MANTPTTTASVSARLNDEEILNLADVCKVYEDNAAVVLRDYVRLRKLNGKLKECLNQAYGDKMNTYRMIGNEVQNWGIVLVEAEKGEVK